MALYTIRRKPDEGACLGELRERARRRGAGSDIEEDVSETLAGWLESVGGPRRLNSEQAKKWLGVWLQLQREQGRARIGRRQAGPSEAREQSGRAVRAGRAINRRTGASRRVTMADGSELTDLVEVAMALINHRANIWFVPPWERRDGDPVLTA